DIFVVSMIILAVAAVYLAILKHQTGNIIGGVKTFYFVTTAWVNAKRRDGGKSNFGWVGLAFWPELGAFLLINGFKVASSPTKVKDGVPVGMFFFIGAIALLSAAGDLRMLVRGVTGTQRLVRHLWRMCFALFIASGSFFLGPANRPLRLLRSVGLNQHVFTAVFGKVAVLLFLAVLPLILMIFWMIRVRFTNAYIRKKPSVSNARVNSGDVIEGVVATEKSLGVSLAK